MTRPFVPNDFTDEREHRRKLAEAINWILDRLEGGGDGESLKKQSGDDYDFDWEA